MGIGPNWYGFEVVCVVLDANDKKDTLEKYAEAVSGPETLTWRAAMKFEIISLNQLATRKLETLPPGAKLLKLSEYTTSRGTEKERL